MIFSYPPNLENYHCYSKCPFSHIIQNPAEIPNDVISPLWAYTLWYNVSLFMLFPFFHDPGWHHCNPTIYQSHSCEKSVPMHSTQEPLYFQNYTLNPVLQPS